MAYTYTPSFYNFVYKKYTTPPNPVVFRIATDADDFSDAKEIILYNLPPWLEVYNQWFDASNSEYEFSLRLKTSYTESMTSGVYTVNLAPWLKIKYSLFYWDRFYLGNDIQITLEVKDTVLLSINPTSKLYTYTIGGAVPQSQLFQITSESNWSITSLESWVVLSASNGVGNGSVIIGVDPTGLPVGTYDSIIRVTDAGFTKDAVVTLTINEGDTETSYLYLNSRNLQFVSELATINTKQVVINLETSHTWTAVASDTWIVVSDASGNAGINDITISVDSVSKAIGTYNGYVLFSCNGIIKKVYVTLIVLEFLVEGITSETLYFADDRNKLRATNINSNTFLVVDATTSNGINNIPYQMEAPYFEGISEIVIGEETNNLLKSVTPTNSFISRVQNSIAPININLTAYNEDKTTEALTELAAYSNLKFLTGETPTIANKLCYIPTTIYVTKNAVLSLSVLAMIAPTEIVITGDVTATIGTSIANDLYVYNAIVNLADFTLATGNALTITFGSLTVNVVIKKDEPETTIIAFENEWRCYEFFETTGFLTIDKSADKTTTELQVEGEKHTKVVSIDIGVSYTLNTGYIYTQEEVEWLTKILQAKRIFIYQNNTPVEITLETKTLQLYKTREHSHAYSIKFKKAIV